jgi:hypothetical protein
MADTTASVETDHISEALLADAYQAGWDGFPKVTVIPWKWHKNKILNDAYLQGWTDRKEEEE